MRSGPSRFAFAAAATVIIFQIACPLVIARQGSHLDHGPFASHSDAARFRSIAEAHGTPYRDFDVEYPPVALGLFRALAPHDFGAFRQRLLALQVACQALIVLLLFRVWSRRAAWSYLVLSTPMLFVVYNGFDLFAVVLAVGGAALVRRNRATTGAMALVVGAFTKLWPAVLLPGLLVRRQARAFGVALVAGLAGLGIWIAWGGTGAPGQVLTYRGAQGWEYESIAGSLLRLVTRDALRFENGSWRVGAPPRALASILTVVAIGAVVAIWLLAARLPGDAEGVLERAEGLPERAEGLPEVAAITAVLVLGTLLSPQFVIWPLPFVAIAAAGGARRVEWWAGVAAGLTLLDWIWFDPYRPSLLRSEVAILGRNVALVGLLVVTIVELRRGARDPAHLLGPRE